MRYFLAVLFLSGFSFAVSEKTCNLLYEVAGECYIKSHKLNIKDETQCYKTVQLFNELLIANLPDIKIDKQKLDVLDAYCLAGCTSYTKGYSFIKREEFLQKCLKSF